jgi:hypothetical protein
LGLRDDSDMRRAAVTFVLVLIAAGCSSSHHARPSPASLRQACVERWNWLHYDHAFVPSPARTAPATVKTKPCRIEIDYRFSRSDPAYKHYLGTYFPCALNRYGAYVCTEHALGLPDDPRRTGQNARYFFKDGTIRLKRPPTHPITITKPDWVRRYPVTEGFIEPFENGKLRTGLKLRGHVGSPDCATFPNIDHSTLIGCGAGLYCFVPRLPVRNKELMACPTDRGSRLFERGRLVVLTNP